MPNDFFRDNNEKIKELHINFKGFPNINITKIECWLNNFDDSDKLLAIKFLENIEYFDASRIFQASQDLIHQIKTLKNQDLSNVYFCYFGAPQKSGYAIINMFATANNLNNSSSKFKLLSELQEFIKPVSEEEEITIVFLDDFVGTGKQAVDFFNEIQNLIPQNAEVFLGVIAAFEKGITNIMENTDLKVICHKRLNEEHMLFSDSNIKFTPNEKEILRKYCEKTGLSQSTGYGNCEACVVFPYRTPNNSVSILGAQNSNWNGLFPRYPLNN